MTETITPPTASAKLGVTTTQSELSQAFEHADDRSQRLDTCLGGLSDVITRLEAKLAPILTNGAPYPGTPRDTPAEAKAASVDTRSEVTRRVHSLGERYDRAADYINDLGNRVDLVIEALEV